MQLVFETHSTTEDNEASRASGWLPGELSPLGRIQAVRLGLRRRNDGLRAVFISDLGRALQTAAIAFEGSPLPVLADWRLRECNYGKMNGEPVAEVHGPRLAYLDEPYPDGESWRAATERVGWFVDDLVKGWDGERVLVIGHLATYLALSAPSMAPSSRSFCQRRLRGNPVGSTASTREAMEFVATNYSKQQSRARPTAVHRTVLSVVVFV